MLTLCSLVNPLPIHSSTPSGASIDVKLAFVTNGSDIMLTVKPLVARMFSLVSFSLCRGWRNETLISGGLCETYIHSGLKATHMDTWSTLYHGEVAR
jgi:hypothetical protein